MRARFSGHPYPGGLFVLDTWTGEVVKVPEDGSQPTVLRPAVVSAVAPTSGGAGAAPVPPVPPHEPAPARRAPSALEREVVHAFPYPIARTYDEYLREPDPRQRCKLLVDTFTQVLKSWSLITASEYLHADGVEDVAVNHTLARDFQRPLISAWNLMLARAIPVLEERGITPLAPELWRAYRALESHCQDKVALETPYKDAAGAVKVRTAKLGRIQALIRYRNSLAHGYNQSRDKANADLATFAPVLESVLAAARFCTRYPLFYAPPEAARDPRPGDAGHTIDAYRLMGAAPARSLERVAISEPLSPGSRLFVYDPARQRALGLGVFFDVDDAATHGASHEAEAISGLGWDVLTFEGHTRTTMIYASVTGGLVEKQSRLGEWRALMARKQVPGAALTLAELTWSELLAAAGRITGETLATLTASGRYIPDVTIARPSYERLLDDFECSDYRAFVVAGDHGMGKSTLLARYAESRRARGDLVLLYRAAALRDAHLQERVLRDLGVRNAFFEDFLAALASVVPAGARVRLIVDSLHEHPNATHELTRAIDALVRQAASYPFMRVLVSIRGAAYERLPADARLGLAAPGGYFTVEEPHSARRTLLVDMAPLTGAQVAEAYERYRAYARPESDEVNPGAQVFRPLTPFAELAGDGATVALMRVPLFVRLLCAAFAHKPLPANLSFDQAMEPYMDHVVLERDEARDEARGGYPERRRFLQTLVKLLDGESADSVARDRLYGVPSLAGHLTNPQKDSAYVQLLELGILIEVWDDDRCGVRFAFEGLFEYLLAELHYPRIDSPAALLALVERACVFKSLRAAVVIIMRRALRTGRHALILDACDMCRVAPGEAELAHDEGARDQAGAMLMSMMRDLIIDLARFRDPGFEVLCREIPATASRFDVQVLTAAFDALFTMGEIAAAETLATLADRMARELDEAGLLAEALFRRARVAVQRGLSDAAFAYLDEASELAGSAGATRSRLRVALLRAQLLVTQGQNQRAARVFSDAHRGFVSLGELSDASVAVRGLASIAAREEQLERAAELGREAIDLAERASDPAGMAKALNNLAMVQSRRGDADAALASFERSLTIKEMIGDRASIATTALNLGALYFGRGDLREAEERFRSALATFEALEHGRGCALSSCNLALLAQFQGDPERASALLSRSIELFEASGDTGGMAHALWFQASLRLDTGRLDDARPLAARLAELAKSLATRQLALQCACLDARIAMAAGVADVEPALERIEALSRKLEAETWDVEDGPASTFLDAAKQAHESRRHARAHALITSARAVVRERSYARARELAAVEQAIRQAVERAAGADGRPAPWPA